MVLKSITTSGGEVWTLGKELGSGGYGAVYVVTSSKGKKGAVKLFFSRPEAKDSWKDEKMLTMAANSVCADVVPKLYAYGVYDSEFYMISELMDGSLEDVHPTTVDQLLQIFIGMTHCIDVLHSVDPPIVHLDLKPSNFLFDNTGRITVTDLGLSCNGIDVKCYQQDTTFVYKDPHLEEIKARRGKVREYLPADVFALGVIFREMMYLYKTGYKDRPYDFWEPHIVDGLRNSSVAYSDIPTSSKGSRPFKDLKTMAILDDMVRNVMIVDDPTSRANTGFVYEFIKRLRLKPNKVIIVKVKTPKVKTPKVKTPIPKPKTSTSIDWDQRSVNATSAEIVKNSEQPWNWDILSMRIDMETIRKYSGFNWNFTLIKGRSDYSLDLFRSLFYRNEFQGCVSSSDNYWNPRLGCIDLEDVEEYGMEIDHKTHIAGSRFEINIIKKLMKGVKTPKARTLTLKAITPKAITPKAKTPTSIDWDQRSMHTRLVEVLKNIEQPWNWDILSARDDISIDNDMVALSSLNWNFEVVKHRPDYNLSLLDSLLDYDGWWGCFSESPDYWNPVSKCITIYDVEKYGMHIDHKNRIAGSKFEVVVIRELMKEAKTPKARTPKVKRIPKPLPPTPKRIPKPLPLTPKTPSSSKIYVGSKGGRYILKSGRKVYISK
jgi:serine/threonine protein kinase